MNHRIVSFFKTCMSLLISSVLLVFGVCLIPWGLHALTGWYLWVCFVLYFVLVVLTVVALIIYFAISFFDEMAMQEALEVELDSDP